MEKKEFLKGVALFQELEDAHIDEVEKLVKEKSLKANGVVCEEGAEGDAL